MAYSNIDTPYSHLTDTPFNMDSSTHMDNTDLDMVDNHSLNFNELKPKGKKKEKFGAMGQKSPYPEIEILDLRKDSITFELTNCDLSFANALRRVMIAEVPTLAFDFVDIYENSSVLDDEFIAHRLGLIPLVSTNVKDFKYTRECSCEEGCIYCSVTFTLDMENTGNEQLPVTQHNIFNVTSHLERDDDKDGDNMLDDQKRKQIENAESVVPIGMPDDNDLGMDGMDGMDGNDMEVGPDGLKKSGDNLDNDPIILVKLAPNQKLKFKAVAKKGIGKEHAKWQPVTVVGFVQPPEIELDLDKMSEHFEAQQKEEFVKCCPASVYSYDEATETVEIKNPDACLYCNECIRKAEEFGCMEIVKIRTQPERFILTVETTGALDPVSVVTMAFEVLVSKLKELRESLLNLRDAK